MAAPLLTAPPNDGELWIPPGALGAGITYLYTLGRNATQDYQTRKQRAGIYLEISHTMGGSGTETPQSFANAEQNADATLAEIATFPAAAWNTGKPVLLQSLPLNRIGAGSVDGGATGLTHESAELAGDPNAMPWTPDHIDLKARLTAWMITNPLLAAGDRKWARLQIHYQICKSPYAPTPELGGLGDHTMWDTCGIQAGGTNPWTLYCKSCPGWERRGTTRKVQFPNSAVTDIPFKAGNFRDYYETVGRMLAPAPKPPQEDHVLHFVKYANSDAWFQDGAVLMRVPGGDLPPDINGVQQWAIRDVPLDYFKRRGLSGPLPGPADGSDVRRQWTAADFLYVLPDGVTGPPGPPGPGLSPGSVIPGTFTVGGG